MSSVTMFTFKNVERRDSVVVVGGGPSVRANFPRLLEYIEKINSIVLVANYEHKRIKADYTYFTDIDMYKQNIRKVKCKRIVVPYRLLHGRTKLRIKKFPDKEYYQLGIGSKAKHKKNIYHQKTLKLKNGLIAQDTMGMAGFGCVFMSVFFKPQKVLLVGFDGPSRDFKFKRTLSGKIRKYPRPYTIPIKKRYFCNTLLPFLNSKGIQIECFESDKLWRAKKDKLGIKHV